MASALRHVHLDIVGGIAGDMFVAAMLDALPDLEARVRADLRAALPAAAGRVELTTGTSGGLAVRRFALVPPDDVAPPSPIHYGDIVALIEAAPLASGSAEQALGILRRLGEAESRIHGVPLAAVHFHEIADWDSLADVVATGSIAAALGGATWSVSDLPRGGGRVRTRHGLMPVPAPATALLLAGFRLIDDGVLGERVTPTGAAILAHLVDPEAWPPVGARLLSSGLGAGTRQLPDMPNIVRAMVHDLAARPAAEDIVTVITFDVDDMTGEEIGHAAERLRAAAGVLDLALSQHLGKKSRPLIEFRLLVEPAHREAVINVCLVETSTIGLRWHEAQRRVLPRRAGLANGPDGQLRLKSVTRPDGSVTAKVEADDLGGLGGLAARRRAARRMESDHD